MDARQMKIEAARAALAHVESGMRLGIGTGSTAEEFVRLLAEKVAAGLSIEGVPTSERTAKLCNELGVPLKSLDELPELDLTIDGADELDGALTLIKGGGGALLREKIVAASSARMIVIADQSKVVETLGAFPLPIEVNPFGLVSTRILIEKAASRLGLSGALNMRRAGDSFFVTDGGITSSMHLSAVFLMQRRCQASSIRFPALSNTGSLSIWRHKRSLPAPPVRARCRRTIHRSTHLMIKFAGLGRLAAATILLSGIAFGSVSAQEVSEDQIKAARAASMLSASPTSSTTSCRTSPSS